MEMAHATPPRRRGEGGAENAGKIEDAKDLMVVLE